jgi:hypothetical protein
MELETFYFSQPHLYLVPIEHQQDGGLNKEYAAALKHRRGVGDDFIDRLDETLAKYRERVDGLFRRAAGNWFPPRRQNLCIVTDAQSVKPYYQPFAAASWLLYESDFDPALASVEFAVFQMIHAERLGLTHDVFTTVLQNLSYFLVRSEAEIQAFAADCRRSPRPDAGAFVALADALAWIHSVYDNHLKPAQVFIGQPLVPITDTDLLVPQSCISSLEALLDGFNAVTNEMSLRYRQSQARTGDGHDPVEYLCERLRETRPRVLIADARGAALWDPDQPAAQQALRPALSGLTEAAATSIGEDLEIIDDCSRRFFDAVVEPQSLPLGSEAIDQEGGVYLHERRGLIVYSLQQPGIDALHEQAPPYHRWLLAARTVHEWGHVAVDAGLAGLDPNRQAEHDDALAQAGEIFQAIIDAAPAAASDGLAEELAGRPADQTLGQALARVQLGRIDDYLANMIMRALIEPEPVEAYIRANVHTLFGQPGCLLRRLARYAYEFQYLGLSRMAQPGDYFLTSTWFREEYINTGICRLDQIEHIFELTARAFACYRIDATKFRL